MKKTYSFCGIKEKYVDVEAHNLDEAIKKAYEENDIDSISTVEPVLINGESINYALCEIPDKSIY